MADKFLFEIVTPARIMRSEEAELVVIPGGGGNFGVLPGHAPMLATLRPGTIEIRSKDLRILEQIFIEDGFAEVTPERCTVLAEEAMRVDEITRDEAEARLKHAHDSLLVADTFGVRLRERELRAAEAMCEALDAYEASRGKSH
ncbi:MAG: ATP synthase F1 subunit epsilon [Rhodobacteraceae bacterium]|nr:ATP synthase F1 subunit epsilon [Paracoccaceae bacterium]